MSTLPWGSIRRLSHSVAHGLAVCLFGLAMLASSAVAQPQLTADFEWELVPLGTSNWQVVATVNVTNVGSTAATKIWSALFLGVDGTPDPDTDNALAQSEIDLLEPDASQVVVLKHGPLDEGPTSVVIYIDPLNLIAEADESDNIVSAEIDVPAKPKGYVDLVTSDYQIQQDGNFLQYNVWVRNDGTIPAGGFDVELSVGAEDDALTAFPSGRIEGLEAGQTAMVQLPGMWLPSGPHDATLEVDAKNEVPELDESNNATGPDAITVNLVEPIEMAELFISDVVVETGPGEAVTYQVSVHNAGSMYAAGPIRLTAYFDEATPPEVGITVGGQNHDLLSGIAAGATEVVPFVWFAPVEADVKTWVAVDTEGSVPEANEGNNLLGPIQVALGSAPARPDLKVTDLNVAQAEGELSQTYTVTVSNDGTVPVGEFDLAVYPDSEDIPSPLDDTVPSISIASGEGLAPGATREFVTTWTPPNTGSYSSWVAIDPLNGVLEADESNNAFGAIAYEVVQPITVNLRGAGLAVLETEAGLRYTFTLTNAGTTPSGDFELALYANSEAEPSAELEPSSVLVVPSLVPNETRAMEFAYAPGEPAELNSWVGIDWTNAIVELDETDNLLGPIAVTYGEVTFETCSENQLLSADCDCGGSIINSGYCCSGGPSVVPCSGAEEPTEDAGNTDEPEEDVSVFIPPTDTNSGGESGGEGETNPNDEPDSGGGSDGGCSSSGSPSPASGIALFAVVALAVIRRRIRH